MTKLNNGFSILLLVLLISFNQNLFGNKSISFTESFPLFNWEQNLPDSTKVKKEPGFQSSALTDTSWSQASERMNAESGDTLSKTGKKPAPPKFIDPYRPPVLLEGLQKAQKGDLEGAIVDFTAALKKFPKNFNAYFYRAKARIESGDKEGAMEDINMAIQYKPDEAIYYYYRGKNVQ
ncbi:MAG: hypothetical protein IPH84_10115 [Bacteroidales bacterium]|nr:hypothetical protein [Bacteroidales bacterium]